MLQQIRIKRHIRTYDALPRKYICYVIVRINNPKQRKLARAGTKLIFNIYAPGYL